MTAIAIANIGITIIKVNITVYLVTCQLFLGIFLGTSNFIILFLVVIVNTGKAVIFLLFFTLKLYISCYKIFILILKTYKRKKCKIQ